MKKVLSVILVLSLVFALVACGSGKKENSEENIRDKVDSAVSSYVTSKTYVSYKDVKSVSVNCATIDDNGDGENLDLAALMRALGIN